ncbi:MAG TPA: hypothetical protein VK654_12605 [Nitrospirota bacterium]|nr:hypothetical protein [Nitrospirota bacterium]
MGKVTYFFAQTPNAGKHPFDGKFASASADAKVSDKNVTPLSSLAGLYWFVEVPGEHKTLSTEEIAAVMDGGGRLRAISGPFPTRDAAEQSLERYWEMITNNGDD